VTAAPYRWHSSPDYRLRDSRDCIDGHQRRTAALVLELCAYIGHRLHDSDLPRWALVHDEAERLTGDVPAHAKRRWGYLAEALERAEAEARRELGIARSRLNADRVADYEAMRQARRLHLGQEIELHRHARVAGRSCAPA
jgi:5'-deoxynucleotidase YfbR-like HD superfamily hydrolase